LENWATRAWTWAWAWAGEDLLPVLTLIQATLHATPLAHVVDEDAGGHREEDQAGEHGHVEDAGLPVEDPGGGRLLVQLLQLLVGQVLQWGIVLEVLVLGRLSALAEEGVKPG